MRPLRSRESPGPTEIIGYWQVTLRPPVATISSLRPLAVEAAFRVQTAHRAGLFLATPDSVGRPTAWLRY
jgi:hypothetical protein